MPATQRKHVSEEVAPVDEENVPTPQLTQAKLLEAAADDDHVPETQLIQLEEPWGDHVPAKQLKQRELLDAPANFA